MALSDSIGEEFGFMTNFAQSQQNAANIERSRKQAQRLAQDRRFVTSQGQTGSWVKWGDWASTLGQPFDVTRIPFSKLEHMRRDPIIAFGLMFCKIPLITARWKIESEDQRLATFVENCLRRIYGRFVLAYCNSFDFGYSPIVKRFDYEVPDWTYIDPITNEVKDVWPDKGVQALVWRSFIPLNPRLCAPRFNARGDFAGIDFRAGNNAFIQGAIAGTNNPGAADVPLDWALWATNEKDSEFGSLYGYPRTGYAYRYWWSYWYKFALSDRAFEKWGDPPFVVFHPADEAFSADGEAIDFSQEALNTAEQLRSGANVAMPSSVIRGYDERQTSVREWDFQQVQSTANFDALRESFEYLDVQKLRSVMVPEQALIEGQGGTSSRNVAATFGDLFAKSQAVVMEEIDEHINRFMIPQLIEANFGSGTASCRKVTTGFDPQDVDSMRDIIQGIVNKNGEIPEVDLRELLERVGIPTLSHKAIQAKLEQVAAQQDQQTQQQQQAELAKSVQAALLKGHQPPASILKQAGLSLEDDFSENEKNIVLRFFDKLFGTGKPIEEELEEE